MPARLLTLCLLGLLLAGCQKVELYSNLSEREGNAMLAALLTHGIAADKRQSKEFVTLLVPTEDVAEAVELLRRFGYPRERFTDLGEIFAKQGLISSPMEERVRYTFGLSQMLSETLTQIDGVLSARVLLVLPREATLGEDAAPSSASVFIKYLPHSEVEDAVPRIKSLVQNSVDGLSYDNITVALFPSARAEMELLTDPVRPVVDSGRWRVIVAILAIFFLAALGAAVYFWWRQRPDRTRKAMASNG